MRHVVEIEQSAQGARGPRGPAGVHVGPDAPTDPDIYAWVDTDEPAPTFKVKNPDTGEWEIVAGVGGGGGTAVTSWRLNAASGDDLLEILLDPAAPDPTGWNGAATLTFDNLVEHPFTTIQNDIDPAPTLALNRYEFPPGRYFVQMQGYRLNPDSVGNMIGAEQTPGSFGLAIFDDVSLDQFITARAGHVGTDEYKSFEGTQAVTFTVAGAPSVIQLYLNAPATGRIRLQGLQIDVLRIGD